MIHRTALQRPLVTGVNAPLRRRSAGTARIVLYSTQSRLEPQGSSCQELSPCEKLPRVTSPVSAHSHGHRECTHIELLQSNALGMQVT